MGEVLIFLAILWAGACIFTSIDALAKIIKEKDDS